MTIKRLLPVAYYQLEFSETKHLLAVQKHNVVFLKDPVLPNCSSSHDSRNTRLGRFGSHMVQKLPVKRTVGNFKAMHDGS